MKTKFLKILALMTAIAMFIVPALAIPGNGNGPKFPKHVASLEIESTPFGQVIYNTNPEDDDSYELEVEVEESSMTDVTVMVYLDGEYIGDIILDEDGNGKATFYVDGPLDVSETGSVITVVGSETLTSGLWRLWVKGKGPK